MILLVTQPVTVFAEYSLAVVAVSVRISDDVWVQLGQASLIDLDGNSTVQDGGIPAVDWRLIEGAYFHCGCSCVEII